MIASVEPIHTLLSSKLVGNGKVLNKDPLILRLAMSFMHRDTDYQFVIDPSGLRNDGIGAYRSVTSAINSDLFGSNSTPNPGRELGHNLPARNS